MYIYEKRSIDRVAMGPETEDGVAHELTVIQPGLNPWQHARLTDELPHVHPGAISTTPSGGGSVTIVGLTGSIYRSPRDVDLDVIGALGKLGI